MSGDVGDEEFSAKNKIPTPPKNPNSVLVISPHTQAAWMLGTVRHPTALWRTIFLGLGTRVLILVIQHTAHRALCAINFGCPLLQVSSVPLACPCPTEGQFLLKGHASRLRASRARADFPPLEL